MVQKCHELIYSTLDKRFQEWDQMFARRVGLIWKLFGWDCKGGGRGGYLIGNPWHVQRMHSAQRFSPNASCHILTALCSKASRSRCRHAYSMVLEWKMWVFAYILFLCLREFKFKINLANISSASRVCRLSSNIFVHVPRIQVKPNLSKTPTMHHAAWSILTRPHSEAPLPLLHSSWQAEKYQESTSYQAKQSYLIEM